MNRAAHKIEIRDKIFTDGFGNLLQKVPLHERKLLRPGRTADDNRETALFDGKRRCFSGDLISDGVGPKAENLLLLEFSLPSP